jgi:hypothetical protein
MPTFDVTAPGGEKYRVVAPEGATQDMALDYVKRQHAAGETPKEPLAKGVMPEQMGTGEQVMTGMADPMVGGYQLFKHVAGGSEGAKKADEFVQQREKGIQERGGDTLARGVGRGITSAPVVAGATALGGLPGAIAGGAAVGMLDPTSGKNFGISKGEQALFGAAFGAAGGIGPEAASFAAYPTVREEAAELMKKGIQLTPGQIAGGYMRRIEELTKSVPVIGHFIRGAEGRSLDSFNKATVDMALTPIGVKLPAAAEGREAISYGKLRLSDAYDSLLPKMNLTMDTNLASDIANIRHFASEMPPAQAKQFDEILKNRVARPFKSGMNIKGEDLKQIESDLNQQANLYRSSSDSAQRSLAHHLDEVRFVIRDALARQNGQYADDLKAINASYAMFARVEGAAARRASSQGHFTPGDLLASIKQQDRSVRKGAFARGDALMQDFGEYAQAVLPAKVPDSGTPERLLWEAFGVGGAAALTSDKILAGAALIPPYTKIGQKAVNAALHPTSNPVRKAVGQGAALLTPFGGTETSALFTPTDQ